MEMLKTFVLKVEPLAGSHINDVAMELCQLADRLGVRCAASFNGIDVWVNPGGDPLKLVEAFHEECDRRDRRARANKIAQDE